MKKRMILTGNFLIMKRLLKQLISLEHDLISILSTNYNLDNLEKSNWLDYKNALENEISLNHISESFHTQRLLTFF